jgi:hypothetical protein
MGWDTVQDVGIIALPQFKCRFGVLRNHFLLCPAIEFDKNQLHSAKTRNISARTLCNECLAALRLQAKDGKRKEGKAERG